MGGSIGGAFSRSSTKNKFGSFDPLATVPSERRYFTDRFFSDQPGGGFVSPTRDFNFGEATNPYTGPRPEQTAALESLGANTRLTQPLFAAGVGTLQRTAAGDYLDVANTPGIKNLADTHQRTAARSAPVADLEHQPFILGPRWADVPAWLGRRHPELLSPATPAGGGSARRVLVENNGEATGSAGSRARASGRVEAGILGGRPRGLADQVRAKTRDGAELIDFAVQLLRDPKASRALRLEAAKWLADRGFGRPLQGIEIEHSGTLGTDDQHDLSRLTRDQLLRIQAVFDEVERRSLATGTEAAARPESPA